MEILTIFLFSFSGPGRLRDEDLPTLIEVAADRGFPFMIESAELAFAPWFMYLTFDYTSEGYSAISV